jgi:hypothetical protein
MWAGRPIAAEGGCPTLSLLQGFIYMSVSQIVRQFFWETLRYGCLLRNSSSRSRNRALVSSSSFGNSIALDYNLAAASKSPDSAAAAANVSRQVGLFHSVSSQARVASLTAFLPSRNFPSGQVALIQGSSRGPRGSSVRPRKPYRNQRRRGRIGHCRPGRRNGSNVTSRSPVFHRGHIGKCRNVRPQAGTVKLVHVDRTFARPPRLLSVYNP